MVNQTFRDYKKVKTTSLPPLFGDVSALESCLCYIFILSSSSSPPGPLLSLFIFLCVSNYRKRPVVGNSFVFSPVSLQKKMVQPQSLPFSSIYFFSLTFN